MSSYSTQLYIPKNSRILPKHVQSYEYFNAVNIVALHGSDTFDLWAKETMVIMAPVNTITAFAKSY